MQSRGISKGAPSYEISVLKNPCMMSLTHGMCFIHAQRGQQKYLSHHRPRHVLHLHASLIGEQKGVGCDASRNRGRIVFLFHAVCSPWSATVIQSHLLLSFPRRSISSSHFKYTALPPNLPSQCHHKVFGERSAEKRKRLAAIPHVENRGSSRLFGSVGFQVGDEYPFT